MKPLKELLLLDEIEQQDLDIEKAKLESKFYKDAYLRKLDVFIQSLFYKYKDVIIKFIYKVEQVLEIGDVTSITFTGTRYIHEYNKENFISSRIVYKSTYFNNLISFFTNIRKKR